MFYASDHQSHHEISKVLNIVSSKLLYIQFNQKLLLNAISITSRMIVFLGMVSVIENG